jgi:uncharacterized membrane protein YphA (DoxX/SURF4 family)
MLVVVGFQTASSAFCLVLVLGVVAPYFYPYWAAPTDTPRQRDSRDHSKYFFYQTMSIMGGLLLLARHGAGGVSLDGRGKKDT